MEPPPVTPTPEASTSTTPQANDELATTIASINHLWFSRFETAKKTPPPAHPNPLRHEYHQLFNCMSRCQKIVKRMERERYLTERLLIVKACSVPQMDDLIASVHARLPSVHPVPYLWNEEEQREVLGTMSMKWEEMGLKDYLTSVAPDDDESDNDVSFDDKYDIVKTRLSEVALASLSELYKEHRAVRAANERAKEEALALEREERLLARQLQEGCALLLQQFPEKKPAAAPEFPVLLPVPILQRSSSQIAMEA